MERNFDLSKYPIRKKYFYANASVYYKGKYTIDTDSEKIIKLRGTTGAYSVLASRVLNLSYPDYLRMCRDLFGATLIGKNSIYITPYFDNKKDTEPLVALLNAQMYNIELMERERLIQEQEQEEK